MIKIFTRNSLCLLVFILVWMLQGGHQQAIAATPVFDVDLVGKPSGTWTSPEVKRDGLLCSATGNVNCVQFNVKLDSRSGGLQFDIVGGPVPSGSMYYQVDCGPNVAVGQPICVTGTGVHKITLCMPGNAAGTFQITSIAAFNAVPDLKVTQGCFATLQAPIAFNESTINWRDITGNGTYNKYLSCLSGCSSPTITPDNNAPEYVDYVVCGTSNASLCATLPYCDTVRVFFYPPPQIAISPSPAIICPGSSGVELTGTVTGSSGNFQYIWTNSAGAIVGNSQKYTASAVGTYKLEIRNENYPNCNEFSQLVNVVSNLTANAGPDQQICSLNPVQLAGSVTAAAGGVWSGGAGSFTPDNTALNAVYTPTPEEIQAGFVKLTLTSTGSGNCTPVKDEVQINFYEVGVQINAPAIVCKWVRSTLTAQVTGGVGTILYSWNTGETTPSIHDKPAGTYTVTIKDGNSCGISKSFTITEKAGPTDIFASTKSTTCGNPNGELTITSVTGGTAPYTYSINGSAFTTETTYTGLATITHTLTVKDANGCTYSKQFYIPNINGPTAVAITATPASCTASGRIEVGTVTGGTAPFSYSLDNTTFQTGTIFTGLAAGSYTVTVRDGNNCRTSVSVAVGTSVPTNFTSSTVAASCGGNNGSLTITGVTSGTAPYTYSKDGVNFQSSATFSSLLPGSYTLTVKDANGCNFSGPVQVTNNGGATDLAFTLQSPACGNSSGAITVSSVTGGNAPFTYSKNGLDYQNGTAFTGLSAGSYKIYVKDANSCVYAEDVVLIDVAGPSFTLVAQAATCSSSNGHVTVGSITNGTAPFTYTIDGINYQASPTFSSLPAGTYTVGVKDANGCYGGQSVVVNNLASPADFTVEVHASTCGNANGYFSVTSVSGGSAPYMYALNGGSYNNGATFNSLAAGTYAVTVKDANNCTFTKSVVINNIAGPTNVTANSKPSTCERANGEITVTGVTGGAGPYIYSIDGTNFQASATFTGLAAGDYTITVKDANQCIVAKSFLITNTTGPSGITLQIFPALCGRNDGHFRVVNVTGGTAPYGYARDINTSRSTPFQPHDTFGDLIAGNYTITVQDANGCLYTETVTIPGSVAGPSDFSKTVTPAICGNNGSITFGAVTGGVEPYTYSIGGNNYRNTPAFTNLPPGTYTISVKDVNGCLTSQSVVINSFPGPTDFTATTANSRCGAYNGEIAIGTVTGGTAPYSYSRDGVNYQEDAILTALLAGNYSVTVRDANGCMFTKSITVNDIAGPAAVTVTTKSTTCGDTNGELTISGVTGGTAPYTYSRDGITYQASNTFTTLGAGQYLVLVKDANNCILSKSITIDNINGPTALAVSSLPATCADNDGSLTAGAVTGGTAPFTFSVDGSAFQSGSSFTGLASGSRTLTVKDANGCIFSQTVVIEKNIPASFASSTVAATCGRSNGSLTINAITGGTAPYTYSLNGGTFQAIATFDNLNPTAHTITVKDANGCTFTGEVTVPNGAGPTDLTASLKASTCNNSNGEITISGISGGTAPYSYSKDGLSYQAAASFTGLPSGAYTIMVRDANGCIYSKEIILNDVAAPVFEREVKPSTCGNSNGTITINSVSGGVAPYTYSKDGTTFVAGSTFSNLAAGTYTISVKDANGCFTALSVVLENIAGPTDFSATSASATCGESNGSITIGSVIGGTAPYTYSKDGVNFQAAATLTGTAAGEHTVIVKDANGCTFTQKIIVNSINGPTELAATTKSTICGSNNGELTVTGVTGGRAPYTYSRDGVNFQTETTFANLLAEDVTIAVKDANGCIFSRTFRVLDIAGPSALAATSEPATCADNNGSISAGNVTGGTAPYTYSINGTNFQTSPIFNALASGAYNLVVKDANACTFTTLVNIEKNMPTSFTSSTVLATCGKSDGGLTISAVVGGTAPYTYSLNATTYQTETTFANLAVGNYAVTVKDANGCTYTSQVQVTDAGGVTDVSLQVKNPACGNNTGEVKVGTVTGGVAPYTYSLNESPFQTSDTFTGLPIGKYALSVKDANGCVSDKEIELINIAGPSFTATVRAASCGQSNGQIVMGTISGGTAPFTFSKDGTTYQASDNFSNLAAGNYTVLVKDANGCVATQSVEVEDVAGPDGFAVTTVPATCGERNGSIRLASVTGGTAPYAYAINGNTFQNEVDFTSLPAGKYSIVVKDATGCTFTKEVILNNNGGATGMAATTTPAFCGAKDGTISVGNIIGGTAPYQYSLDGITYQQTTTFSGLAPGSYTVKVKDDTGCQNGFTADVPATGLQTAVIATAAAACGQSNGSLTIQSVTGSTGALTYSLNNGNFQAGTNFTGLAAGSYTVTIKDAEGCTLVLTKEVENTGGTEAFTVTATNASCGNNNGGLTISNITGGQSPFLYSINGTTYQASNEFNSLAAGTYQVSVKDAAGCIQIKSAVIGNSPLLTKAEFTVIPAGCNQTNGQVQIERIIGGTAPFTYSLDGINFVSVQSLTGPTGIAPGSYTLTVKDARNCTLEVPVTVNRVTSTVAYVKDITCQNTTNGSIAVTTKGKTNQMAYSIDNGVTFQADSVFNNLAKGTYTIITRFSPTCSVTVGNILVKEPELLQPVIKTTAKAIGTLPTGSVTVSGIKGVNRPYTYQLNNGNFTADTLFKNLVAGEHTLVIKDKNGCTTTVSFLIDQVSEVEIPDGFTPNGDGMNDNWVLANIQVLYPNCKVSVYNRWGNVVFQSVGYKTPWDGTHKGQKLPDGTYYCVIEFNNTEPPVRKAVTIMR